MNGIFLGKIGISAVVIGVIMSTASAFCATPDGSKAVLSPVKPSKTYLKLSNDIVLKKSDVTIMDKKKLVKAVFTIANNSKVNVKDIKIVCTFVDKNQKELDRETWVVLDTVRTQTSGLSTMTSEKVISKDAIGTQCQIVDVKIVKTQPDGD